VVGVTISDLLRGGSSVGQATLTRYYSAHLLVLPWLIVFMLLLLNDPQSISGPL